MAPRQWPPWQTVSWGAAIAVLLAADGSAASGTCTEALATLPREEPAVRDGREGHGGDAACGLLLEELSLEPLDQTDALPTSSSYRRHMGPVLETWMGEAAHFLRGPRAGQPLDEGPRLGPAFRALWLELSAHEGIVADLCPEAAALTRLLWALLWVLAAHWVGDPRMFQMARARLSGLDVGARARSIRLAAAEEAVMALASIDIPPAIWRGRLAALTHGHGGVVWSTPFHVAIGRSRAQAEHVPLRDWPSRAAAPESLQAFAFIEVYNQLTRLASEVWPAGRTLLALLRYGALEGYLTGGRKDRLDGSIEFLVGVAFDQQWSDLVMALAEALVENGSAGCYLAQRTEQILDGWSPGTLECFISSGNDTARVEITRYYVLEDGQRVMCGSAGVSPVLQPFAHWGIALPSELLQPSAVCSAWGSKIPCPGSSLELLRGWNSGELSARGCLAAPSTVPLSERVLALAGGARPSLLLPELAMADATALKRHAESLHRAGFASMLEEWSRPECQAQVRQPPPLPKEDEVLATDPLKDDQQLLIRWLGRRAISSEGNSLCFSEQRQRKGLTFAACCGATARKECWEGTVLTSHACCRRQKHTCADLRIFSNDMRLAKIRQSGVIMSAETTSGAMGCLDDDLYRSYFEDVRALIDRNGEAGHGGILGTYGERFVASTMRTKGVGAATVCLEVAMIASLAVQHTICEKFLSLPLTPEKLIRQQQVREDLEVSLPQILSKVQSGEFTPVAAHVWILVRNSSCAKVIEAEANLPETVSALGHSEAAQVPTVAQTDYWWPNETLAGQPLSGHGLHCAPGKGFEVGRFRTMSEEAEAPELETEPEDASHFSGFVDFSSPMPTDGRLDSIRFAVRPLSGLPAAAAAVLGVMVVRLEQNGTGLVHVRKATSLQVLDPVDPSGSMRLTSELLVWRGDFLGFILHNAQPSFRTNCADCEVAELPERRISVLLSMENRHDSGVLELGARRKRSYSWSVVLLPMQCAPVEWHRAAPLPARQGIPPAASQAHCSQLTSIEGRTCTFSNVCYDLESQSFEFFGSLGSDAKVGLSMWVDGRGFWQPLPRKPPPPGDPVAWVDVPTYLALRRAPNNWGHYFVETVLGIYALALAGEDFDGGALHGRRMVFFLDDCSLVLKGDAIEYCTRFDPDPLGCIAALPPACARFTRQLWPLLSDWAPLEPSQLGRLRSAGGQRLCFRSLRAGLAPWRRPMRMRGDGGGLWAPDPQFAPVVRIFRSQALARLELPSGPGAPALAHAIKTNRRLVLNRPDLLGWLEAFAEGREMRFLELDFGRSLAEQVALLNSARLLVASAGSCQMAGAFLRAGSGLLVLPQCMSVVGRRVQCQSEEVLATSGLRWAEYPVAWEDAVYDMDRGFSLIVRREVLERLLEDLLA